MKMQQQKKIINQNVFLFILAVQYMKRLLPKKK